MLGRDVMGIHDTISRRTDGPDSTPRRRGARGAGHSDPDSKREDRLPCIHDKLGLKRFTELLASEKEMSIINRKRNIIILLDGIDFVSFMLSICLLQPRKYTETQLISFLSQNVSAERPYLQVIQDSAFLEQTVDGETLLLHWGTPLPDPQPF